MSPFQLYFLGLIFFQNEALKFLFLKSVTSVLSVANYFDISS